MSRTLRSVVRRSLSLCGGLLLLLSVVLSAAAIPVLLLTLFWLG